MGEIKFKTFSRVRMGYKESKKSSTNLNQSQFNNYYLCSHCTFDQDGFLPPECDFRHFLRWNVDQPVTLVENPYLGAASNASSFLNEFQLREISIAGRIAISYGFIPSQDSSSHWGALASTGNGNRSYSLIEGKVPPPGSHDNTREVKSTSS